MLSYALFCTCFFAVQLFFVCLLFQTNMLLLDFARFGLTQENSKMTAKSCYSSDYVFKGLFSKLQVLQQSLIVIGVSFRR